MCGEATERDGRYDAVDRKHPELIDDAQKLSVRTRDAALDAAAAFEGRVRVIASVREIAGIRRADAMIVATSRASIVSVPETFRTDLAILDASSRQPRRQADLSLPMLWRNGSASVLFHEAIAHPAEHRMPSAEWPQWLTVTDEPPFAIDDRGRATAAVDLFEDAPRSWRRDSFREIPRQRMSRVIARQHDAPHGLPARFIAIELASGGSYDPMRDEIRVHVVAASEVNGQDELPLHPFEIGASRSAVASSLKGASGEPLRYPGVICSFEGHETYVASHAPLILTEFA